MIRNFTIPGIFFLCILSWISTISYAQQKDSAKIFIGQVYNSKDFSPIEFAHIINLNGPDATISDQKGNFQIRVKLRDTLNISSIGYEDKKIIITHDMPYIFRSVALEPKSYKIGEVEIRPWKTYRDFKNKFMTLETESPEENVHPLLWQDLPKAPYEPEPIEPSVTSPISFIYSLLSDEGKEQRKYKEILQREKIQSSIESKYNAEIVKELTGLEGEELREFMKFCNFTNKEIRKKKKYDLLNEVKRKYQIFKDDSTTVSKNMTQ